MNGLYVLGGLVVAAGAYYVTTRILLRRELDRDAYRQRTAVRIKAAGWRTHSNVVYLDGAGGYAYAPTKTDQPRGGGSYGRRQRLEEGMGVASVSRGSLAAEGSKGSSPGLPQDGGEGA